MTSSAPKRIKKESLSGDEAAAADKGEAEAAEEVGSRILLKFLKG